MNPLRRLRTLFRRRHVEAEMAEEMRFHLEQRAADLAADGLPPADARHAAQRKFGNTAVLQERARETFGWGALERFAKDLAFAARQLLRAPGFSILAILTLGLGIGANSSMFSLVNGIVLKPLPYANLAELDRIWRATPNFREGHFSLADFLDLQRHGAGYRETAGYWVRTASMADPSRPAEALTAAVASTNLFSLLGVQPQHGRGFHSDEGTIGRHLVVILSQRVWQNRYGARADIVGQSIRIDGEPHEVVGVLPSAFNDWRFLGSIDLFLPLAPDRAAAEDRRQTRMRVLGRRLPGVDRLHVDSLLAGLATQAARAFPAENADTTWWRSDLQETATGSSGGATLTLLIALSGFVLLLACANLANLYLVRTLARLREFAVRSALGASRLQLLRPLAAESLLLSLAGGGLGLLVVAAFHQWARVRSTADNGEQVHFVLDGSVLAWTVGASFFTAFAFGLVPALYAGRVNVSDTLKSGGRGMTGGAGTQRFRRALIVGQFALALVLLSGAAIFIRGLHELHHRRGGWEAAQLVTGTLSLPTASYPDDESIRRFQRLTLERLRAMPGVESATLASSPPFFHWSQLLRVAVDRRERPAAGAEPTARLNAVDERYFATVQTPLLAGRLFDQRESDGKQRSYLISQSTARALFGADNPLGRRLAPATTGAAEWGEIVGVVSDVETVEPDADLIGLQIYQPLALQPPRSFELLVRVVGNTPLAFVPELRQVLAALDPDLPVQSLRPAQLSIERSLYQQGFLRDMLATFGLLGLALASIGIYGVLARTMAQRSGEFAIRLALGAEVRDLARLIFASGARLVLVGSALGLLGAVGVSRLLLSAYPGISANSALVLALTTFVLVGVALLACWLPARQANRINPTDALRAD
jgi:predicted permease